MNDIPAAPPPAAPPAAVTPPSTPAEASTQLTALKADPVFTEALMRGDPAKVKEFHSLHEMISKGDDVDVAMSGTLPSMPNSDLREMAGTADMLRSMGFTDLMIRETLSGKEASEVDVALAKKWKADNFSNADYLKRLFSGDVQARRELLVANIILNSPLKKEKA
jgi:hypothetical protein